MIESGSTIKLGNLTYTIEVGNHDAVLGAGGLIGDINYNDQVIRLHGKMASQKKFQVLCHEVIHGLLEGYGLTEYNKEEFVNKFEPALAQFLVDNLRTLNKMFGIDGQG